MSTILLIVIGILALTLGFWLGKKYSPVEENEKSLLINKQPEEKRKHLGKILEVLEAQSQITNNEVEKICGVSNATAERYLDELEKEGKIKQVGKTGRDVFYEIK